MNVIIINIQNDLQLFVLLPVSQKKMINLNPYLFPGTVFGGTNHNSISSYVVTAFFTVMYFFTIMWRYQRIYLKPSLETLFIEINLLVAGISLPEKLIPSNKPWTQQSYPGIFVSVSYWYKCNTETRKFILIWLEIKSIHWQTRYSWLIKSI